MSALSKQEMLDVMAFADGELEGKDADRVRALVEKNVDARELVRSVGALGDFVRASERESAPQSAIDVSENVMQRIAPTPIERARLKRGMRMRAAAAVATVAVLAAGFAIYARSGHDETAKSRPIPAPPTAVAENKGVQVDTVDTPESVSVFYLDDEANKSPTTVVWITDDETPETPPPQDEAPQPK